MGERAPRGIPEWTQGDRLSKALDHAGMRKQDMAKYLHVSVNTVSNYVSDRTKVPYPTLIAWAQRTEVDLEWLLTGVVPPQGSDPEPAPGADALRELADRKLRRVGRRHADSGATAGFLDTAPLAA